MLNCTVCGHDNFPFTDSEFYTNFGINKGLQMVSHCHKCSARIAKKCKICDHLHPLNTTHCPLYGLSIQEFLDFQVDLNTRVVIFKDLPEVKSAIAQRISIRKKYVKTGKLLLTLSTLGLIFGLMFSYLLVSSSLLLCPISLITLAGLFDKRVEKINKSLYRLWKDRNSDTLDPAEISVYPGGVKVEFGHSTYRISSFMLNQAQPS